MIEYEKTYLAKYLPPNLKDCENKEIYDIYIPKDSAHARLRIRKNGDRYEMTKKVPLDEKDASTQEEHTIPLDEKEFQTLRSLPGKEVRKIRFFYVHEGMRAEFDVFQDDLKGLVVVDFEFTDEKQKESFVIPDFCLADITQEDFIAGGMICGKNYEDVLDELKRFGYEKIE